MLRFSKKIPYPDNILREVVKSSESELFSEDMKNGYYFVLSQLSEEQQGIIKGRYEEKLTYKQLSQRFSIGESSISDRIHKIHRILRHPSRSKYIRNGLLFCKKKEEEALIREETYKKMVEGLLEIKLEDMEEISAKTYKALSLEGFETLNSLWDYIKDRDPDWWMGFKSLEIISVLEISNAISYYKLDNKDKLDSKSQLVSLNSAEIEELQGKNRL